MSGEGGNCPLALRRIWKEATESPHPGTQLTPSPPKALDKNLTTRNQLLITLNSHLVNLLSFPCLHANWRYKS